MKCNFFDIHSHVMPKMDDGSESLERSLKVLRNVNSAGTNNLVLTPHFSERRGYTPSKEIIEFKLYQLQDECMKNGIDINLYLGSEVEYSADIPEFLKNGNLVTINNTKYILLEFAPYISMRDMIYGVKNILHFGYIPILAHIERYNPMRESIENVLYMKELGAFLQVNSDFIISRNFLSHKFIKTIIKNEIIDFIAGDVHRDSYTGNQLEKCFKIIENYSSNDYAKKIMFNNAYKIVNSKNKGE